MSRLLDWLIPSRVTTRSLEAINTEAAEHPEKATQLADAIEGFVRDTKPQKGCELWWTVYEAPFIESIADTLRQAARG